MKVMSKTEIGMTCRQKSSVRRGLSEERRVYRSNKSVGRYARTSLVESVKGKRVGRKWREYQGAGDWEGLLNPVDPILRSEILRYGYFVEAAYRSFEFDPSSDSYGTCRYRKKSLLEEAGFPDTGYRVTKNLRATSGISMPRWTGKAGMQSSWIGYVAVCRDKAEIQRLGRRDVVIALRGTATCLEWMENLRANLTDLPSGAGVETGFLSLYTSATATSPSLQDTLRHELARILEIYKGEELSFTITGHSLGAALATLAAYDLTTTFHHALLTVISFGGPRVGDTRFRRHVDQDGTKILRVVNPNDVITKLPGFLLHHEHTPHFGYADVGRQLTVTDLPNPYSYVNFAKSHDLKTYLNLVAL